MVLTGFNRNRQKHRLTLQYKPCFFPSVLLETPSTKVISHTLKTTRSSCLVLVGSSECYTTASYFSEYVHLFKSSVP